MKKKHTYDKLEIIKVDYAEKDAYDYQYFFRNVIDVQLSSGHHAEMIFGYIDAEPYEDNEGNMTETVAPMVIDSHDCDDEDLEFLHELSEDNMIDIPVVDDSSDDPVSYEINKTAEEEASKAEDNFINGLLEKYRDPEDLDELAAIGF